MKVTKIVTKIQQLILDEFSENKYLTDNFVLSGGTALAGFYLPYRFSEDLDFFSLEEVNVLDVTTFLKSVKAKIIWVGILTIENLKKLRDYGRVINI